MRLTRWLRSVVATGVAATAMVAVVQAPAKAAFTCSHRLVWYHSNYEVSATEEITCGEGMSLIWARVKFTTPSALYGENYCYTARSCVGVTWRANTSALVRYCATAYGYYRIDFRDAVGTKLPEISSCIYA